MRIIADKSSATDQVVPPAALAVHFHSFYVISSAEGTAYTFFEPSTDAFNMVFMFAEKNCICVLLQADTAGRIGFWEDILWFGMFGPGYFFNFIGEFRLLLPFYFGYPQQKLILQPPVPSS